MDVLQIVVLALVQGITEFLPISSSAHLIIPSALLGWPDQGLAFDVAVHVGSLLAVVAYFRRDIAQLFNAWTKSLLTKKQTTDSQMAWFVIVATVPAAFAGLIFNDLIETHLRSITVIAVTTIVFGLALWLADRRAQAGNIESQLSWRLVFVIGLAQVLALIPGTSRSGITMTAALWLGLSRELAARFSFLLSIPLILAAGAYKALELVMLEAAVPWFELIAGAVLSAVSAYLCIHLFLQFIEKVGFLPFVVYRLVLGCLLLFITFS